MTIAYKERAVEVTVKKINSNEKLLKLFVFKCKQLLRLKSVLLREKTNFEINSGFN
jgi:hypothetical protein